MKKSNAITYHLAYIAIISILVIIIYLLKMSYHHSEPIDIEPELFFKLYPPGSYTGTSTIGPTKLYKNGLICEHNVINTKNANGLDVVNNITAYDAVTKKLAYKGVRKIKLSYKPNHDDNLFIVSKSYINNKLVSSFYGYATEKTSNSISFNLSGSWHVSNKHYHNIYKTISKPSKDTVDVVFKHYNMFGINDLTIDEKYKLNH